MERFMELLHTKVTEPLAFGWYHLMCIGIMIALVVLVMFTCRKLSDKQKRIIMIVLGTVMILFELLKQLRCSYDVNTKKWEYDWFYFPFQFCSVPMYVLFIAGLCKPSKFREYLTSFIGTFGLLAGLLVMFMPGDVFTDSLLLNIHTMVHHGLMVVMGFFVYAAGLVQPKHTTILKAAAVFGVIVAIAFTLNALAKPLNIEDLNLFYIGPYKRCHLIGFSMVWDALGITGASITFMSFVFLAVYVAAFSVGAYIMLLIYILINFIRKKKTA